MSTQLTSSYDSNSTNVNENNNQLLQEAIKQKGISKKRLKIYLDKLSNKEDVSNFAFTFPKTKDEAKEWTYNFWNNQPVTQLSQKSTLSKVIDSKLLNTLKEKYRTQTKMLEPYEWKTFDLNNDNDAIQVVDILNTYYVEGDDTNKFIQIYTVNYLQWLLGKDSIVFGVKAQTKTKEVIGGIICAKISEMQLYNKKENVVNVEMIYIHKKLRENGIFELLVNELKRICGEKGIRIGKFLTTSYIPTPVCKVEFYHRPINYRKLNKLDFVHLKKQGDANELELACDDFKITQTDSKSVIMTVNHIQGAYDVLCDYQDKYNIYEKHSLESFIETFYNNNCLSSYVILDKDENVQDFFSYYKFSLRNKDILDRNSENHIRVARMYMYTSNITTPLTIYKSALICANKENIDVFTTTDIMENLEILYDNYSKFSKGITYKWINFYNWECPEISPEHISIPIF